MEKLQTEIMELGRASGIRGLVVVSNKEGKLLGKVSHVFVDPVKKKLSGIVVKDEFWSMSRQYIPMSEIEDLGEDVVFIKAEKSCEKVSDLGDLPGMSIKDLQGKWITTREGKHLGQFLDANFSHGTWGLSELILSDNRVLKVTPDDITLGEDEVMVPKSYADKIVKQPQRKSGIMSLVFGEDTAEQVSKAVNRAEIKPKASSKKPIKKKDLDRESFAQA